MKATIQNLRRAVETAGGKLEEDFPGRDTRNLQMVAPDGKRWAGRGVQCAPVDWAMRESTVGSARKFNADAYADALETLKHGLEEIPQDEMAFYAND